MAEANYPHSVLKYPEDAQEARRRDADRRERSQRWLSVLDGREPLTMSEDCLEFPQSGLDKTEVA